MSTMYDIRLGSVTDLASFELGEYAFASSPRTKPDEDRESRSIGRERDRSFFSYIGEEAVAKVNIIPMTMNVRGTVMPMGGISGVASMPAARRGGHIRELMLRSITDMHEQGQAISALYPFKTTYYEKFGYAGWQAPQWVHIDPAAFAPYMKAEKSGTVIHKLSADVAAQFNRVLIGAQARTHGLSLYEDARATAHATQQKRWNLIVLENDEPTGGLSYRNDLDKNHMIVDGVFWNTFNAMLQIFDYLARHVDQISRIRMPIVPGSHPQLWTSHDDTIEIITNDGESWGPAMARVVDVAGLNGVGAGEGTATLTISDAQAPWNNGTFTFSGKSGALQVTEGGESQGDITIHGLSALLFSGIDPRLLPVRGWGSVQEGSEDDVRAVFPPITPFIHAMF